jgi:hypothetical protein
VETLRQGEDDALDRTVELVNFAGAKLGKTRKHLLHEHFRRRRASRHADPRFTAIHSARSSSARSIMYAGTPRFAATSRNRLEFELFGLPTTMTTSVRGAIALTASWRFCVA